MRLKLIEILYIMSPKTFYMCDRALTVVPVTRQVQKPEMVQGNLNSDKKDTIFITEVLLAVYNYDILSNDALALPIESKKTQIYNTFYGWDNCMKTNQLSLSAPIQGSL